MSKKHMLESKKSTSKKYRFGIVSYDVMSDPELSSRAKGLYALLCCYADKDRKCYPSKSRLADELNVSYKTLKRYLKELYSKKLIKREGKWIVLN